MTKNQFDNLDRIQPGPRLVSILSGKGGVGKSIITFNLGERLAAEGYRVLLVDTDIQCGNLHILANLAPKYGISDFAHGHLSLREAKLQINNSLDLLPAPISMEIDQSTGSYDLTKLMQMFRRVGSEYDLILIDHASGVSDEIIKSAASTDAQMLVLIPELTSIADAYGLFKRLSRAGSATKNLLLVNRTDSSSEAEHVAGKFMALAERFIGQLPGYAGCLSDSEHIRGSVARQRPLAAVAPQSNELQELRNIARCLVEKLEIKLAQAPNLSNGRINIESAMADIRG